MNFSKQEKKSQFLFSYEISMKQIYNLFSWRGEENIIDR